jgi:AcrR family transcriptional regulator
MAKSASLAPVAAGESSMRERILGAAFRVFTERGYAGASTLEIATRAKVSKRDLYGIFGSKQAILVECIAGRAARMRLSSHLPAPRTRETLASTLTTYGANVVREASHPAVLVMFRLCIAEAERSPEAAETLTASRTANRDDLAALFAQAQQTGVLGAGDPHQMVEQFLALLWGDLMMDLLLRAASAPAADEVKRRASTATQAFLKLYAAPRAAGR